MIGKVSYIMKRTGDNTKFVYKPKREQKAKFVYKGLYEIARISIEKNMKGCVPYSNDGRKKTDRKFGW